MASERIDLTSSRPTPPADARESHRSFVGIHFACCGVYGRIYANASGSAFAGHCPRCGRPIEVGISPAGEARRFFSAY